MGKSMTNVGVKGIAFEIDHGNLRISVPHSLFKGRTAVLDQGGEESFKGLLSRRYPWLSNYALDIIVENARRERERRVRNEQTIAQRSRDLLDQNRVEAALALLEGHLRAFPNDADALYVKGEALCRLGRRDEGYSCMGKARSL